MVKVSSDNSFEEELRLVENNSAERTYFFEDPRAAANRSIEINRRYDELPAQKNADPNINYFGSSYSGVDIKVVAHLYDALQVNEEFQEKINQEIDYTNLIIDGAQSLLNGGLDGLAQQRETGNPLFFTDPPARRELFIAATGINQFDEFGAKALRFLVNSVWKSAGFDFLSVARMKRAAEGIITTMTNKTRELSDRADRILENQQNSTATLALGTLQTISVQSHREKFAVRALGHSYAKAYTRGPRTIAGSMIFTVFDEHALSKLIRSVGSSNTYGEKDRELTTLLPDQLPPLDLTIVFANEYGSLSDRRLYGVEFVNDGVTYSIEDLLSENVINFVCRDADVMTKRGNVRLSRLQRGMFNANDDKDMSGSSLLFDNNSYNEYLERLKVRRRLNNR